VLLLRADEEGRGKHVETVVPGNGGSAIKTKGEAVAAAVRLVEGHGPEVFGDIIGGRLQKWNLQGGAQATDGIASLLPFPVRMDVGVIPTSGNGVALRPPIFNRVGAAVGAADMQEEGSHQISPSPSLSHQGRGNKS